MAENNFVQWNPGQVNQETDEQYSEDPLRTGGAISGAIFPDPTANKLFYQLSTFIAAFAQMMQTKGFDMSDADKNSLSASLSNIITENDIDGLAPILSPKFKGSPTVPTPPDGDATQLIPNTAWVAGLNSLGASGFQKFPSGLMLQWITGPVDPADASTPSHNLNWATAFKNVCLMCVVSMNLASFSNRAQVWYQTIGFTKLGLTYMRQAAPDATNSVTTQAYIFAIGF